MIDTTTDTTPQVEPMPVGDMAEHVEALLRRVADLEEWLGAVADDLLDRTARPA